MAKSKFLVKPNSLFTSYMYLSWSKWLEKNTWPYLILNVWIYDHILWLPWWLSGKESTCNAGGMGNAGLIPGVGRSPGRGNGNPLQYSWQEHPMDRGAKWATVHRIAKSRTWPNNWHWLANLIGAQNPTPFSNQHSSIVFLKHSPLSRKSLAPPPNLQLMTFFLLSQRNQNN